MISISGGEFDFGRTQFNISKRKFLIHISLRLAGS
jgi:hypothetical protein